MNHFQEILKVGYIHVDRINLALKELKDIFPLDAYKVENFNQQELLFIELLVSRFAKLQDFLGRKVISEFLSLVEELEEDMTMLDKIHKLERLGILEQADLWKEMREARNHISHEYPCNPALTAQYLNQIFNLAPQLIHLFQRIKERSSL